MQNDSDNEENDVLLRQFREYTAAVIDKETAKAAELYANYSEDETFIKLTKAYHAMCDGFREGQRLGAIEFLKENLLMNDYDIAQIEEAYRGTGYSLSDLVGSLMRLKKNINDQGVDMPYWKIHEILQSDDFWKDFPKP